MRHLVIYKRPKSGGFEDEVGRRDYGHSQQYYDDDRYGYDRKYRNKSYSEYEDPRYYYEEDDYEDLNDRRRYRDQSVDGYEHSHRRNASFVLPNEQVAEIIMSDEAFCEYIAKNGYHFTKELAECASKMLVNSNGREHKWSPEQIRQQLILHGVGNTGKLTLGDITFLANMAYADFYPEVLTSEQACIKYAIAVSKDPDGYDGIVFSRWIADLIGRKNISIDWEKYV